MEKETLALPKVPDLPEVTGSNSTWKKRKKAIEYTLDGKILKEGEVIKLLEEWKDFVCGLVPNTTVNAESYIDVDPTRKEQAMSSRQSLLNHLAILGEDSDNNGIAKHLIENADKDIESAPDTGGGFVIHLMSFEWNIENESDKKITISEVDFRFIHGKEVARVWPSDELGGPQDFVDASSWIKGVSLYIKNGKQWLAQHAPELEISDIPDLSVLDTGK